MRVNIDKAGRIVVPKPIRERFGLRAGTEIELEEAAGGIMISAVEPQPSLIRKRGILVFTGKLPPGVDGTRLVQDDREARIREIGGW